MSFEMCLQLLTCPVIVVGLTVIGVILIQAFAANNNEGQYMGILSNHLNNALYQVVIYNDFVYHGFVSWHYYSFLIVI